MGVFQQPANSPSVWCYIEWLWVVLNTYLLLLWEVTHTIKTNRIRKLRNPNLLDGQGQLPIFSHLQGRQGGLAVSIV